MIAGNSSEGPPLPGGSPARVLLVVLPALNEESTVGDVIRRIPAVIPGLGAIRVLVIDDGSTDGTAEKAVAAGAEVIRHAGTRGVGAAFHTGLAYGVDSGADLIVTIDADGQFDPADIPALVRPVLDGEADFATASRFKNPALIPAMPWIKRWGNRMMSRIISGLARQTFYDVSCGMRCYAREAAVRLCVIGHFTYTQEVILDLAFKKMRIAEVPIPVRGEREFGRSRVAGNLWSYGFRSLQIILRSYRDYHPLRFFGAAGLTLLTIAAACAGFLAWHYLRTGGFTPHKWAGFTAAALVGLAALLLHAGLIGDMLNRHRLYLEELLCRMRGAQGQIRPDKR